VLTDDTYEIVLDRCRREIEEGETKHLLVLIGVPIAYPRLVWLENILTSRAMGPVKALGRAGIFKGGFLNKFDGGVEVLDDLDDHWTATGHKEERNNLVRDLQELAAEKSVRITILGGDVHLAAVGQFYSNPKLQIPKDRDHRYIPNVISSAIVNTPPPEMLADTLNKRNKIHHLDHYTVEDMIPMFTHDVNGSKRNNKRLLPRRNWCSIREYHPGSTPPPTPPESLTPSDQMSESEDPPQNRRRFSFSREDANPRKLLRRLSQRGAPPSSYRDDMYISSPLAARRASHDGYFPNQQQPQTAPATRTSFPINNNGNLQNQPQTAPPNRTSFNSPTTASYNQRASIDALPSAPHPRPGILRRPTNLSEKAAKRGGPSPEFNSGGTLINEDLNDHINLEGGLDITLNCEVNQGDPAGITTPYRLLVPALRYDGSSDSQKIDGPGPVGGVQRKPTLLKKLGFGRTGNRSMADRQGEGNWGQPSETESETYSEGQYSQEDDGYYEKEKRSSGSGLKRWFSGRSTKRESWRSDRDYNVPRDPPGYEQVGTYHPSQPQRPAQTYPQQQGSADEFVGKELKTTPPLLQQTIEPFPSQARGKAARVMGVDQGPLPTFAQPQSQPSQRQRRQSSPPLVWNSVNASHPLPPPSAALGPAAGLSKTRSLGSNGNGRRAVSSASASIAGAPASPLIGGNTDTNRFYAAYDLAQPTGQGRQRGGQGQPQPQPQLQAEGGRAVVQGYDGVEAYTEKGKGRRRGSVLRRLF
jgi:PhoD related phosphatase